MGAEARCTFAFGKKRAEGKALRETDALIFRGGDVRLSVPYRQIPKVEANAGALRVTFPDGLAVFAIGDDVKVARFSETHTAEKFVIPVARRVAARSDPTLK